MNIITTIFPIIIAHCLHYKLHTVQSWSIYQNWSEYHYNIPVGADIMYEAVSIFCCLSAMRMLPVQ